MATVTPEIAPQDGQRARNEQHRHEVNADQDQRERLERDRPARSELQVLTRCHDVKPLSVCGAQRRDDRVRVGGQSANDGRRHR